jgi:hypothetical protein
MISGLINKQVCFLLQLFFVTLSLYFDKTQKRLFLSKY